MGRRNFNRGDRKKSILFYFTLVDGQVIRETTLLTLKKSLHKESHFERKIVLNVSVFTLVDNKRVVLSDKKLSSVETHCIDRHDPIVLIAVAWAVELAFCVGLAHRISFYAVGQTSHGRKFDRHMVVSFPYEVND